MKSRWDSLKPDQRGSTRTTKTGKPRKSNAQKVVVTESQQASSPEEKRLEFFRLQRSYLHSPREATIVPLVDFIQSESEKDYVPANILVDCVVDALLPRLGEIVVQHDSDNVTKGGSTTTSLPMRTTSGEWRHLLLAIKYFIQNRNVASLILAPSVEEIGTDGMTRPATNPLFFRIARLLSFTLRSPTATEECRKAAADSLTDILSRKASVEGYRGNRKVETTKDFQLDPAFVYTAFETALGQGDLAMASSTLSLIQELVKQFPEASARIGSIVLLPKSDYTDSIQSTRVASKTFTNIQLRSLSCWLSTWYHSSTDPGLDVLLSDNTICLLEHAPFVLWLRQSDRSTRSTISSFHDRIRTGLCSLIRICTYRMQRDQYNPWVIGVATSILLHIPFKGEDRLATEAVTMVDVFILLWTGEQGDNATQIAKSLTGVMGGVQTPQGNLTTMSIPVRIWLQSDKGKNLMRSMLRDSKPATGKQDADFLQSVTRTLPSIILCKDGTTIWRDYVRFIDTWDHFRSRKAAELVQSLLQGKKDFNEGTGVEFANDILQEIIPRLRTWVVSGDTGTRISALACYSLLGPAVWNELIVSSDIQQDLMMIIASTRQDEGTGQKIRSEACRSLGEVTTNLVPVLEATGDLATQLVQMIFQQLISCLDDSSNSVVSMAMFGLGNLAQALSSIDADVLPVESQCLLFTSVVAWMKSDDPKTATNAVRAAAWTVCMLGQFQKQGDEGLLHDSLDQCLERISTRIKQVLALERGELSHFSWKQRSAVKKLGWGGCNALAIIFSKLEASSDGFWKKRYSVVTCVQLLYLCLENLPSANEKLVATAMAALRSIEAQTLCHVTENKVDLVTAICSLFEHFCASVGDKNESKFHRDMGKTLAHLLDAASIQDIRQVLDHCQTNEYSVGALYEWAKQEELPADMWGKLALAAQQCTTLDVYWEQRFVNYAHLLLFQPELSDEL